MTYAADHADALADIRDAGAAVTCATVTPGTHDPATGMHAAATTSTVAGYAIKTAPKRSEEEAFRAQGAVLEHAIVLLFAATTFGQKPSVGASLTWDSAVYRVAFVTTVEPKAGEPIVARVGCVR